MTGCIAVQYLSVRGQYPVIDVLRVAGPGPYRFGYALAHDGIRIDVARSAALSPCQMRVTLETDLNEPKDILAWNLYANSQQGRIGSAGLGLQASMVISSALASGQACGQNTDTLVLRRKRPWPDGWTAFYWFPPQDLWDFWGGCEVTFTWIADWSTGPWGDQTAQPTYPIVALPDGTLMRDAMGNVSVVFGGTDFAIPPAWIPIFDAKFGTGRVPAIALPSIPVDGTLLREITDPKSFVVFGGAKFGFPDDATRTRLFPSSPVNLLPPGALSKLPAVPIDGTLLREETDGRVFLIANGKLSHVLGGAMEKHCLPWRHVRIVPDTSLANRPTGPDIT